MSWRKIEKVWDEVRSAQQPKRNLSKQPKKSKEVKLSAKDDLYQIITVAFDNESLVGELKMAIQAIDTFIVSFERGQIAEYAPDIAPEFYNDLEQKGESLYKDIMSKADDLGLDLQDILIDYSESDYNNAVDTLNELSSVSEQFVDSLGDLEAMIKRFI